MATLRFKLLEHISRDDTASYSIAVGGAESPICHCIGKEVKTCTSKGDAVGASAILCRPDFI